MPYTCTQNKNETAPQTLKVWHGHEHPYYAYSCEVNPDITSTFNHTIDVLCSDSNCSK